MRSRLLVHDAGGTRSRCASTGMVRVRSILCDEVHPVLTRNLCVTAGAWDPFDQAWLAERILAQQRRPRWLSARGRCLRRHALHLWRLLERRIVRARIDTATIPAT